MVLLLKLNVMMPLLALAGTYSLMPQLLSLCGLTCVPPPSARIISY